MRHGLSGVGDSDEAEGAIPPTHSMDLLVAETSNIAATTVSAQEEEVAVNFVHSLDSLKRQRMTMNKLLSAKSRTRLHGMFALYTKTENVQQGNKKIQYRSARPERRQMNYLWQTILLTGQTLLYSGKESEDVPHEAGVEFQNQLLTPHRMGTSLLKVRQS